MMKVALLASVMLAGVASAQHTHGHPRDTSQMIGAADAAMAGGHLSDAAKKHLELSPTRRATKTDSVRARQVAQELKVALAKYADTAAAVADGYKMFMPNVKNQRVYHFTNYRHAFLEAWRFDVTKPTSILYQRASNGELTLIGAMYTAPKRMDASKLDERIPLSIARWHKHVNWCVPKIREQERWLERRDGQPLFGPQSPIAMRADCERVGGRFYQSLFGWMIHANVFLGENLDVIFGDHH